MFQIKQITHPFLAHTKQFLIISMMS